MCITQRFWLELFFKYGETGIATMNVLIRFLVVISNYKGFCKKYQVSRVALLAALDLCWLNGTQSLESKTKINEIFTLRGSVQAESGVHMPTPSMCAHNTFYLCWFCLLMYSTCVFLGQPENLAWTKTAQIKNFFNCTLHLCLEIFFVNLTVAP